MELFPHQAEAVEKLHNGSILYGNVGTGKSFTAAAYYMKNEQPKDVYVITTAKKRESLDWEGIFVQFGVGTEVGGTVSGVLVVDSFNNIQKYIGVEDAFFIFDEQRLVGYGAWVKAFLKIAKKNNWLMLTATPGDTWMDYAPVFIANNLYRNITEFKQTHVVYAPYVRYPKIVRYNHVSTLEKYRNMLLVEAPYVKHTTRVMKDVEVEYDTELFRKAFVKRWNPYTNKPIRDAAELFRVLRRIVNSDASRLSAVKALLKVHDRLVVFYNFDYELEVLRTLTQETSVDIAEWNGHRKHKVPTSDKWVYLVQYMSGAESWNCTSTDTMVFYSLTYSFKNFEQAQGRIDRMDTPYSTLFYYVLFSNSIVDRAVRGSLDSKQLFNERKWVSENFGVRGQF